ncbi:MAG: hypothetical protein GY953_08090, partial [bacterium]|nr:hypothetical protein [bacterium]
MSVHESLAVPLRFSTKGKPTRQILNRIANTLPVKVQVDPGATELLSAEEAIRDELSGLSGGTALAAALRPLGLVMVPRSGTDGAVRLVVVDSRKATQSWPVGWPPDKPPRDTMPQLFKFLPVEIKDITLEEALGAVGGRLEAPMLR